MGNEREHQRGRLTEADPPSRYGDGINEGGGSPGFVGLSVIH